MSPGRYFDALSVEPMNERVGIFAAHRRIQETRGCKSDAIARRPADLRAGRSLDAPATSRWRTRPSRAGSCFAHRADRKALRKIHRVHRLERFGLAGAAGRVDSEQVPQDREAPRLVHDHPMLDAIAERISANDGVIAEDFSQVAIGPSALVFEHLRQVPMVERDPRLNVVLEHRVDDAGRKSGFGPATLNYFPLPNTVGTGSNANIENYFESASATHPRRNDVLRLDPYITSKVQGYFRYINDYDDMAALYQGVQFTAPTPLLPKGSPPIDHPNPGHGYAGSIVATISPTLINEFTMGYSWNTWSYYSTDGHSDENRGLIPNIPSLFPLPTGTPSGVNPTNGYLNLLPEFSYRQFARTERHVVHQEQHFGGQLF